MKLTPNQIQALERYRKGEPFFPYSREHMISLDSADKMNLNKQNNTDIYPAQFTPPLSEYGYGEYQMGKQDKIDLSGLNQLTSPQRPPVPAPTAVAQKEPVVAPAPEEKKEEFDGAKEYLNWYKNKTASEPIKFASIRDKLERGW